MPNHLQPADPLSVVPPLSPSDGPLEPVERLVLVYAANSGLIAAVADGARKLLKLNACALCTITHGLTGERRTWTECREALGVPIDAYHLDDMPEDVRRVAGAEVPAILAVTRNRGLVRLLGPDVIARCGESVEDLRGKILYHAAKQGLAFG